MDKQILRNKYKQIRKNIKPHLKFGCGFNYINMLNN